MMAAIRFIFSLPVYKLIPRLLSNHFTSSVDTEISGISLLLVLFSQRSTFPIVFFSFFCKRSLRLTLSLSMAMTHLWISLPPSASRSSKAGPYPHVALSTNTTADLDKISE